jgi:hypothetical protein
MTFDKLKFAAYLDEADDDPLEACKVLVAHNIKHVCLRRAWCRDIATMPDTACASLLEILKAHKITPILLVSTIGEVPVGQLVEEQPKLERALLVCNYFKCPAIRLAVGQITKDSRSTELVERWTQLILKSSLATNVVPTVELSPDSVIIEPAAAAIFLKNHRRFNLLYDPAVLIMQRSINPFVKYWSLLRTRVSHLDIHDYKIGGTTKLAGSGDAQIDLTIADALSTKFGGWYCLESGLGRRFGDIQGKARVFECALNAFQTVLLRVDAPKIL